MCLDGRVCLGHCMPWPLYASAIVCLGHAAHGPRHAAAVSSRSSAGRLSMYGPNQSTGCQESETRVLTVLGGPGRQVNHAANLGRLQQLYQPAGVFVQRGDGMSNHIVCRPPPPPRPAEATSAPRRRCRPASRLSAGPAGLHAATLAAHVQRARPSRRRARPGRVGWGCGGAVGVWRVVPCGPAKGRAGHTMMPQGAHGPGRACGGGGGGGAKGEVGRGG